MKGTVDVHLPQEILDSIVNNLHDIQALRQCALTARCLLTTAQRILFREVGLLNSSGWSRLNQFLSLLDRSPHLAIYITTLYVYVRDVIGWGGDFSYHPVAFILPRLQSLSRVSIYASTKTDDTITSLQISTLLGGVAMPKIKSFTLIANDGRVDTHEVFGICNQLTAHGDLQDLHFRDISISDSSAISLSSQTVPSPIYLRRLTIHTSPESIDAFLPWATSSISPLRFNALREFAVGDLTQQSSVYFLRILAMATDSISCLHFMGDVPCLFSIQFNAFRNLRRIVCVLNSPTLLYRKAMLNKWCIALKESGELKLESFVISLREDWLSCHDYPWNELEDALISGGRCAHFVLQIRRRIDTDTIRECFPRLHTSDACDLVVTNMRDDPTIRVSSTGKQEYTSRSGEWKDVLFDDHFD